MIGFIRSTKKISLNFGTFGRASFTNDVSNVGIGIFTSNFGGL